MQDGAGSRMSVRPINVTECGSWLTPASDTGLGENQETFLKRMGDRSNRCAQSLPAQVRMPHTWPTPTSSEHKYRLTGNTQQSKCLGAIARREAIGTPTQRKWGTPRCFMQKDALTDRGKGNLGEQVNEIHKVKQTGQLNPSWVEWLMGWPIGWTDLKPLETDKYRNVQQWHLEFQINMRK